MSRELSINLGERAFEIVLARKVRDEGLHTAWFNRHGSTPVTNLPSHWPADYRTLALIQELSPRFPYTDHRPRGTAYGDYVMADTTIHQCQCLACAAGEDHPDVELHRQLNLLLSRLNEQQRRWLAALEATKIGHGGDHRVARITGL